jgi:hypothetical protein
MDDMNSNPLRIVEDDIPFTISNSDNESDNDSNGEVFDFSASEIEELEGKSSSSDSDDETTTAEKKNRNSLLIIEDKDLIMESSEDFNNNCDNIHRLSLQIESGDSDSLVMTNEAANRTIIRIGSTNGIDFGETDVDALEQRPQQLHETINHKSGNESDSDNADNAIVNILGQINEIVRERADIINNLLRAQALW